MSTLKNKQSSISGDDFIKFLSSATPEEVSQMIMEKGKPRKLVEGIIFFDKKPSEKA